MSVVVYQCDTCRREIDIVRNERGLDTVNRCVITNGCKGTMYQIEERRTSVFGRPLEDVEGLDNYRQRNILYIHEQLLSSPSWTIEHNLNTDPAVVAYIDFVDVNGTRTYQRMDPDDYVVTFVDGNNILVEFATGTTGLAHVISRSSNTDITVEQANVQSWYQVTANSVLTIGIPFDFDDEQITLKQMSFISPSTSETTTELVAFTAHNFNGEISLFNTPWQDTDIIFVGGRLFKVKSVRISDIINSQQIENGSPFFFTSPDNILILTARQPYSSLNVDTDLANVFRASDLSTLSVSANSRVDDSELTIDATQLVEYHPNIKIIDRIF